MIWVLLATNIVVSGILIAGIHYWRTKYKVLYSVYNSQGDILQNEQYKVSRLRREIDDLQFKFREQQEALNLNTTSTLSMHEELLNLKENCLGCTVKHP